MSPSGEGSQQACERDRQSGYMPHQLRKAKTGKDACKMFSEKCAVFIASIVMRAKQVGGEASEPDG